jgi:hypothetical protein
MKLGNVIAAAVLVTPIPFAGMTNPAVASSSHTVVVSGWMRVTDSGAFFSIPPNQTRIVNFTIPTRTLTLTHTSPSRRITHRVCAAGETTGKLTIQLVLQPSQRVDALAELKLYEESVCENLDLDDTDWASTSVNPGQTKQIDTLWVTNAQEFQSWDSAEASVTVTQKSVPSPLIELWQEHCRNNREACRITPRP